jgi:hypothetical protein
MGSWVTAVVGYGSDRWDKKSCTFSKQISESLSFGRYEQIKRVFHLVDNSSPSCNSTSPAYNPAAKVALFPDTIVNRVDAVSTPDMDQVIDETTWGTAARGPSKSELVKRIRGKPGVTKGGQHVVLCDATRKRPRAILPRHKKNQRALTGSTAEGPNEVLLLLHSLMERNVRIPNLHITADNYFSNIKLFEQLPEGVTATMTLNRGSHPSGLSGCLYKEKVLPHLEEVKAARHCHPVVAVKGDTAIVSMMSTGATNFIIKHSAYKEIGYYGREKEMGRGEQKRRWEIEMNEARALYLITYGIIDRVDRGIRDIGASTICCRWYVPANLHFFCLAVVVARDLYEEAYAHWRQVALGERRAGKGKGGKGKGAGKGKGGKGRSCVGSRGRAPGKEPRREHAAAVPGPSAVARYPAKHTAKQFRELLSTQMLGFNLHDKSARHYSYPEEIQLCKATTTRQRPRNAQAVQAVQPVDSVRYHDPLGHLRAIGVVTTDSEKNKNPTRKCAWCGKSTSVMCTVCNVPLGLKSRSGHACCFSYYHDPLVGHLAWAVDKEPPPADAEIEALRKQLQQRAALEARSAAQARSSATGSSATGSDLLAILPGGQ